MASKASVSQDAFSVYRGTEHAIDGLPTTPGAVYFTTDTERLYFDDADGLRHSVGASGIKFVYGSQVESLLPAPSGHGAASNIFPRSSIAEAYEEMGVKQETYGANDIILNKDGSLYRIIDIDDENCYVTKILVAGTGGGGGEGEQSSGVTVMVTESPMAMVTTGTSITLKARILDSLTREGHNGTLYVEFYASEEAVTPFRESMMIGRCAVNASETVVTIPYNYLRIGTNVLKLYATVNGRKSPKSWETVQVIDIHLVPNEIFWKPTEFKRASDLSNFNYNYTITYDTTMSVNDFNALINTSNMKIAITIDRGLSTEKTIGRDITNSQGAVSLEELFIDAAHGNHTLDVEATMTLNGATIPITEDLHYEIGWYVDGNMLPIIWSPFKHEATFENYTLINIPYMVIDPANNAQTEVFFYVNGEEVSSLNVSYNDQSYAVWEIANYELGDNVFTIVAGQTSWSTTVTITRNTSYTLEPEKDAILELAVNGRSNNESFIKRAQWKNRATKTSNKVLKRYVLETNTYEDAAIELNGFNWYNNGWVKDKDNNTCLRVSNGASIFIPCSVFSAGGNQTYEFEFAIHNATDYSRLIKTETIYLTLDQLSEIDPTTGDNKYKWFDEETRTAYPYDLTTDPDRYYADEQGLAHDRKNNGNLVPQINPKTGDEVLQRTVTTNGRGTFLQYYASNKGLILGTQEAFLALSQSMLVNARYTDDERVKVSFVVSQNPSFKMEDGTTKTLGKPTIFAYINGVITNIATFPEGTPMGQAFAQNADPNTRREGIYIYSDYCDIDIYGIRIYENDLPFSSITQNWTADGPTLRIKKERYDKNQGILDPRQNYIEYANAKASKLIPIMVIKTFAIDGVSKLMNELPYKKGDTKGGCNIRYYDPFDPERCWKATNVTIDVQGTSSQGYPRRNFQLKLKEGSADWNNKDKVSEPNPFRICGWDGDEANVAITEADLATKNPYIKYKPNSKDSHKNKGTIAIGTKIDGQDFAFNMQNKSLVLKADYMDSSSSHNTPGANLVDFLSSNYGSGYDLRHPLKRLDPEGATENYRTTVFGFPILLFWEKDDGSIQFVGRYNINTHKECENTFGFTYEEKANPDFNPNEEESENNPSVIPATHPYIHTLNKVVVDEEKTGGELKVVNNPTFADVCECWEFRQNQAGHGKFQDDSVADNWFSTSETTVNNETITYYEISEHFEQRYPEMEGIGVVSGKEGDGNDFEWRNRPENLHRLWNWIRQTDVTSYIGRKDSQPVRDIGTKYYKTLSTTYEPGVTYYAYNSQTGQYEDPHITVENTVIKSGAYINTHLELDDNGNIKDPNLKDSQNITFEITDSTKIWTYLKSLETDGAQHTNSEYVGEQSFLYINDGTDENPDYHWHYGPYQVNLANDVGINFVNINNSDPRYIVKQLVLTLSIEVHNFHTGLYEQFTVDNDRYRLAKFRNEFSEHLNLAYVLFYFVFTEFFLLYDSRQKNMMIASWGPEREGGEYIWYPIFYDLDTQLGINNSGQIYWDYDVDATPPLTTRTIFKNGVADVEIYSATGSTDSIFSGNGSVLWNNVQLCFSREIANLYKAIRSSLKQEEVTRLYETYSSNRWSESMKNYDAFYKYIAPAINGLGYTAPDHSILVTEDYFYCLQGDRSLQRQSLIRNRFNYIDSNWSAAAYDPINTSSQIKMRYNLNDKDRTSDDDLSGHSMFDSNATFIIKPYLSQYVTVLYDQTAAPSVKFNLGDVSDSVTITPPSSISKRASLGVALTQQLAYIRGPQYISSIGDLAPKYLNELVIDNAIRLRELKVGDDTPGYRNDNLTSLAVGKKGLLRLVDLSNLAQLNNNFDTSQCPKLEVLKLLGTQISAVPMPEGNVLKTIYLPATVASVSLISPLKLTTVLTDVSQTAAGQNQEGLYIEDLTDKLSYALTNSDSDIPASVNSLIERYQMDDTLLGYETYKMLAYLVKLKRDRIANPGVKHTNTTAGLRIQVLNADWTPYRQLAADEDYDETQINNYYYRDYIKYRKYFGNGNINPTVNMTQFEQDKRDGLLYLYDTVKGESPITNLQLFNGFIVDKNSNVSIDNYHFRPLTDSYTNQNEKLIPTITGKIHIHNTADTPINEAEVYSYYQATGNFPKLDITADYVTEANRARFIEFLDNETHSMNEFGTQKYASGFGSATVSYSENFEKPRRLHYDFMGWAIAGSGSNQYTVEQWRDKVSQIDKKEALELIDAHTILPADSMGVVDLSSLSLASTSYTLVAVYSKTPYTISYMFNATTPATDFDGNVLTGTAYAGEPIQFSRVNPYKSDLELPLAMTYHFLGWTLKEVPEANDVYYTYDSTRTPTTDKPITFFAQFKTVSVYDYPIPGTTENFNIATNNAQGTEVSISIKKDCPLAYGKICIPRTITVNVGGGETVNYTVTKMAANGVIQDNVPTATVENGQTHNAQITHIFFEGMNDEQNPCRITEFGTCAFAYMPNLRHLDIPQSLNVIGPGAVAYATRLVLHDPINASVIGTRAFIQMNSIGLLRNRDDADNKEGGARYIANTRLVLTANVNISQIGLRAFENIGYETIEFGTVDNPVNTSALVSYGQGGDGSQAPFRRDFTGEAGRENFVNAPVDNNGQVAWFANDVRTKTIMLYLDSSGYSRNDIIGGIDEQTGSYGSQLWGSLRDTSPSSNPTYGTRVDAPDFIIYAPDGDI